MEQEKLRASVCESMCVLTVAYIHICTVLSIYVYINNHEFTLVSLIYSNT